MALNDFCERVYRRMASQWIYWPTPGEHDGELEDIEEGFARKAGIWCVPYSVSVLEVPISFRGAESFIFVCRGRRIPVLRL